MLLFQYIVIMYKRLESIISLMHGHMKHESKKTTLNVSTMFNRGLIKWLKKTKDWLHDDDNNIIIHN
jgi:hypothetical protein